MPSSPPVISVPPSYTKAIKSLSSSHVSLDEKLATCRHLISSNYHPDPSTAVLQFLSSCISKDCPSIKDCYTIQPTASIAQQQLAQQWSLMSHALLHSIRNIRGDPCHRESPLIPDAVIIQGGLHLLRGSELLKESASEALYLIVENTRYTRDLDANTWLFCAVARAEGPPSLLAPLRSAVLSNLVKLLSREQDKDRVAAAAACIASHAVPSGMAFEIESTLVCAIRASLPSFHSKFAPWVFRSEESLPQAIQFLLRSYARHPLKKQEFRSSEKRAIWDPAQRDAADFFDNLSQHIHDALRGDSDPASWDEKTFRSKMGAVSALYMTGSENATYSSVLDFGHSKEKRRRSAFGSDNKFCTNDSKTHGILKLILRAPRLAHSEAQSNSAILRLVFHAIGAIAEFSFVAIDDVLPEIMELFLTPSRQDDSSIQNCHKIEFFCDLLKRYERSRAVSKFIICLVGNSRVLESLMPTLKHTKVQTALASTFGHLRGAEGKKCLQSLVTKSRASSRDILGLTLISSLLLETISGPLLHLTADTIANDIVDILLAHTAAPETRHCRTHLLASFLLARNAHKSLFTERNVLIGVFRLALPGSKEDASISGEKLEYAIINALTFREEALSPAELCSSLRCLTALAHYAFRHENCSDDHQFISQVIRAALNQFQMLRNLNLKPNLLIDQQSSLSRTLYVSLSIETVLPWIGSIGYVLRKYLSTEMDDEAVQVFLKHSFLFFPAIHPFWRELSEETICGPKILKAAITVMNELSGCPNCPKRMRICSASRVLETLSVLPVPFLNGPDHQNLLDYLVTYIKSPCCSESRQHALKAFLKQRTSPFFRKSMLTLCGCRDDRSVLERNRRLLARRSQGKILSPYDSITAAIRVLASQTPEQLLFFMKSELASVLTAGISRIRTDFETGLNPSVCSPVACYEIAGVLIDLRANLNTTSAMDVGRSKILMLEKITIESIKTVLPVCLKLLSKDSKEGMNLPEAATDMLSAISRSTSLKNGENLYEDFSDTVRNDQIQVCVTYLIHPRDELQKLAIVLLAKLSGHGKVSSQSLDHSLMSLLDTFFAKIQVGLNSILRKDGLPTQAVRKNIFLATRLSACCRHSWSTITILGTPASNRKDSNSRFVLSVKLLLHLEAFLRMWSLAVQDMSEKQLSRFRATGLLTLSDSLVCSLLQSCLHFITADRSWAREDLEKILLLTRQVVERVCSGKSFLDNEGTVLLTCLRICRSAAKVYTALVPSTTQVIVMLLRRSLSTENETVLKAVREAVEEICVLTKKWETLSALLADCSTALTQAASLDSRREVERTTAVLFKAVSEPRAQQVLASLPDSGKEALTHVWQMYSDSLVYSGN